MKLDREQQGWALLAGAGALALAFHVLGGAYDGWALALGSIREPTDRHLTFLFYFVPASVAVAALMAVGLLKAFHDDDWPGEAGGGDGVPQEEGRGPWSDAWFLPRAVLVALAVPAALRLLVLGGMPLTDDESLYRFAAELLLAGSVGAESHPAKLFFDHAFLVNDGRMFPQYFLGWPAFLAVGEAVGGGGYVNAVLSALTVVPLYRLTRALAGRTWARVTVLLFLTSLQLQLLAATELSHTSALFALSWVAWLAWQAVENPEEVRPAVGLGVAFSVAFFIRPLTALGIGGPFLVWWAARWWRHGRRPGPALGFLAPAVVLAVAFLAVNAAQTGSPLRPAYMAWQDYARANAFRFSGLDPATAPTVPNLAIAGLSEALRTVGLGLARLNVALLGWASAFVFAALALGARGTAVFWASAGAFLLLHTPLRDPGIDTVGPVHFTELALPVLVLSAVGLRRLAGWWDGGLGGPAPPGPRSAPGSGDGMDLRDAATVPGRRVALAAVAALVVTGAVLYAPVRLQAVRTAATLVSVPFQALDQTDLGGDVVVFSSVPWALPCNPTIPVPSRPFVFWWPLNNPDFTDPVLHANHLSTQADRALMQEHFPDRTGWILHWTPECTLALVPLDAPEAEALPNGAMVGGSLGTVRWDPSHRPDGTVPQGVQP